MKVNGLFFAVLAGLFSVICVFGANAAKDGPPSQEIVRMDPFRVFAEQVEILVRYFSPSELNQKNKVIGKKIQSMEIGLVRGNSPAAKAGLKTGMTILRINGVIVSGRGEEDFVNELAPRLNPDRDLVFTVSRFWGGPKDIVVPRNKPEKMTQ